VETPVLIVGAGPTGLLLAAELRRRGVECTLIDARDEPRHWDRATILHARTMELFATLGIADQFLEVGVHQWGIRIFSGGEQLAEMDLSGSGSRYGFSLDVSEEVTEQIITDYLEQQGGSVTRGHKLVGLEQCDDKMLATVESDGGTEQVRAGWVVGCGGLRSPVREIIGIPFEGHDIADPWAVFDLTLEGWASEFDVNFAFLEDLPVILSPLPGERWRAYLRPSSPDSDLVAEAAAVIGRYDPGAKLVDVANPRRFDCHSKVAARYRDGRALLAGDAAHVCTPAQGHGMNSGIQDSFNLAWKLAHVVKGEADEALLDSYEVERRPVALAITASGDAFEQMQVAGPGPERAARDQQLRDVFADPESNHREVAAEAELDIDYAESPIVTGESEVLAAGSRLPTELQPSVGAAHTLIAAASDPDSVQAAARLLDEVGARAESDDFFEDSVLLDLVHDPDLAAKLGVDGLTVLGVRPDGHLGLRHDGSEAARRVGEYVELVRSGGRRTS
jgi:2-polyprenyl-6-methoxyphenol hydroxylase-like FAD-dependent oxidoreductase